MNLEGKIQMVSEYLKPKEAPFWLTVVLCSHFIEISQMKKVHTNCCTYQGVSICSMALLP